MITTSPAWKPVRLEPESVSVTVLPDFVAERESDGPAAKAATPRTATRATARTAARIFFVNFIVKNLPFKFYIQSLETQYNMIIYHKNIQVKCFLPIYPFDI